MRVASRPVRGALAVLVALLLAAAPAAADSGSIRAPAIAAVALHPWGLGPDETPLPFWPLRNPTTREQVFSAIQAMGVRRARVDFRWDRMEPLIKGVRDWSEFDAIHSSAEAHGITLLPVVGMPPAWANGGEGPWAFPLHPKDFEDFMAAALDRYPDIPAWEIWNEPNLAQFAQPSVDPAKFVDLLIAAHNAKARVGSSALIVSGGLSPTGMNPMQFFEDMIRLHAFDYVDGFGIHPYSPIPPEDPGSFFLDVPQFHDRLVQIGRPNVGVWITEYGAPNADRPSEYGPPLDGVEQVARLRSAFAIASRWPWVQDLTWYEFQDACTDPSNVICNFGLVHEDMSPKPAVAAMREIVHGDVPPIDSTVTLARTRPPAVRRRPGTPAPLAFRGTFDAPGAERFVGPVLLTLSWSPRFHGASKKRVTLEPPVQGGVFTAVLRHVRAGRWRAVARFRGSAGYAPATSRTVTVMVRAPRRRR